ncbi:hypothetical protein [Candidatus Odyssella acanthamoebae]|nr:hypothetical protein [Candidatus Paracaedibacter acanthamoebae]
MPPLFIERAPQEELNPRGVQAAIGVDQALQQEEQALRHAEEEDSSSDEEEEGEEVFGRLFAPLGGDEEIGRQDEPEAVGEMPAHIAQMLRGVNLRNLDAEDPDVVQGLVNQILQENPQLAQQLQGVNLQAVNAEEAEYTVGEVVRINGVRHRWNGTKLVRL